MFFILYFIKILVSMLIITFIFWNWEIINWIKSTAILFIISVIMGVLWFTWFILLFVLLITSYVLFLTIFKMESHAANASVAWFAAFMFLTTFIWL